MRRQDILQKAAVVVSGDRDIQYGSPEDNFAKIAEFWTVYLGVRVLPHDVATMMMLLKIARIKTSPGNEDHWIDIAGYAACGGEVSQK